MILETERLILRELTKDDYDELCIILQDEEIMYAYEHGFSKGEVTIWLNNQLRRYEEDGFGLWAVIHKHSQMFIGQAGLTVQDAAGKQVVEIGYLFHKDYWHNGYATEAAIGCKEYAFEKLGLLEVYSIIRDTNFSSQNVAVRNDMAKVGEFVKHYYGMDMLHYIYRVLKY